MRTLRGGVRVLKRRESRKDEKWRETDRETEGQRARATVT